MEEWKVIFESEESSGQSSGNQQAAASQQSTAKQNAQNAQNEFIQNAGAFVKQLLPFAGPLAVVIQSIRRSKIFSTFMDSFLTVLSAMVDILIVPLVPLLGPALRILIAFLPLLRQVSNIIAKIFDKPAEGFKDAANAVKNFGGLTHSLLSKFMGGAADSPMSKLARVADTLNTSLTGTWSKAFAQMGKVFEGSGDFWTDKLPKLVGIAWEAALASGGAIWQAIKDGWAVVWQALTEQFPELQVSWDRLKEGLYDFYLVLKFVTTPIKGMMEFANWFEKNPFLVSGVAGGTIIGGLTAGPTGAAVGASIMGGVGSILDTNRAKRTATTTTPSVSSNKNVTVVNNVTVNNPKSMHEAADQIAKYFENVTITNVSGP